MAKAPMAMAKTPVEPVAWAMNLAAGLANMAVFLGGYTLGTQNCPSTNK